MAASVPTKVLSDALTEKIAGRRTRAAVFTTFTFEPGFFEEEVLPLLFDQSFSHYPKIRLMQLEEALRGIGRVSVYYDRRGLITGGAPASLNFRRIPVSRPTGYFHPKVLLLLTDDDKLLLASLSANLTRAGWWENVECADIREIPAGPCSFRRDLLELIASIRSEDVSGGPDPALEEIRKFIHYRLWDDERRSAKGRLNPRLFTGKGTLPEFLARHLPLRRGTFNLEVISPYFDDQKQSATLSTLVETLGPKETRVFLPRGDDLAALCRRDFYVSTASIPAVKWATLPRDVVRRSKDERADSTQRFVHAKVYRLWSRDPAREFFLIGSANLTGAAHSRVGAGNLEAGILFEHPAQGQLTFWLEPLEQPPLSFRPPASEEEAPEDSNIPVRVRYFWGEHRAQYFWETDAPPDSFLISSGGAEIGRVEPVASQGWVDAPAPVSERLGQTLRSTSFVEIRAGDASGTVLVIEEGMAHKPSLFEALTAEEILRYWSLLSPEQREAFLTGKARELMRGGELDHLPTSAPSAADSLFDKFAGIFHAFARLEEHVRRALDEGRATEAVYRLFGRKYDSLPSLVERVLADEDGDLANRYVTLLTAQQLIARLNHDSDERVRSFFAEHRGDVKRLNRLLAAGAALRARFSFADEKEQERFFEWFEKAFLKHGAAGGEP